MKKSFKAHGPGDSNRLWIDLDIDYKKHERPLCTVVAMVTPVYESHCTSPFENQKFRGKDISRSDQEREETCSERNCACACYRSKFTECSLSSKLAASWFSQIEGVLLQLTSATTLDKKKEPSSRFAARRTLFHVWYHARSGAISAGQKSRIGLALRWSCLIEHDITRGTAFFSPRISMIVLFLSRVVVLLAELISNVHSFPAIAAKWRVERCQVCWFMQLNVPETVPHIQLGEHFHAVQPRWDIFDSR